MKLTFDKSGELESGLFFQVMPVTEEPNAERFLASPATASSPWRKRSLSRFGIPPTVDGEWGTSLNTYVPRQLTYARHEPPTIVVRYPRSHIDKENSDAFAYFNQDWTELGRRTIFKNFEVCETTYAELIKEVPLLGVHIVPKPFAQFSSAPWREVSSGRLISIHPLVADAFAPLIQMATDPADGERKFWPLTGMPVTPFSRAFPPDLEFDECLDYVIDGRLWHGEDMVVYQNSWFRCLLISRRLAAAVRRLKLGPLVLRAAYVRMDGASEQVRRIAEEWSRIELPLTDTDFMVFSD